MRGVEYTALRAVHAEADRVADGELHERVGLDAQHGAAGQAVAVAHVAAHALGAAAYAIRASCASAPADGTEAARVREREWQRDRIPTDIRALVLDDQRLRSAICWHVFDD